MAYLEFIGCLFTAFSPAVIMVAVTVINNPTRIIITILSAFCWLLAIILSSILWCVVPYEEFIIFHMIGSVIMQEVFRWVTYKLVYFMERMLHDIIHFQGRFVPNDLTVGYISGLGFGVISSLFFYANILTDLFGPGTTGLKGDPEFFNLVSAIVTACFIMLHTFWGIIFFHSMTTNTTFGIKYVVVSHLLISAITLLHQSKFYYIPILIIVPISVITVIYGYKVSGGSYKKFKHFLQHVIDNLYCHRRGSVIVN